MSWLWWYLAISTSFVCGWCLASAWTQRRYEWLCGKPGCLTCSPRERRQPQIPDGVLILQSPKQRLQRASTN
ncbi:MAG: hypothetical protein M3N32_07885 [Actinomycetota bacterium]|nr:hypothetical protein [Actinomycetota bacterium]